MSPTTTPDRPILETIDIGEYQDNPIALFGLILERLSHFRVEEDFDPTIEGYNAPRGCLLQIKANGQHWQKTGKGRKDWDLLGTGGTVVTKYLDLTDTPVDYVGHAGKVLAVNAGATGQIFTPATIDVSGNMAVNELKIKVYSQNTEPTLGADQRMAIWIDTDDSNRTFLLFRRGAGDQISVELA